VIKPEYDEDESNMETIEGEGIPDYAVSRKLTRRSSFAPDSKQSIIDEAELDSAL
jgi:hypothetical protein